MSPGGYQKFVMPKNNLDKLTRDYYDAQFRMFPGEATLAGDHRFDSDLGNYSKEGVKQFINTLKTIRTELGNLDTTGLDHDSITDRDALVSELHSLLTNYDTLREFERNPSCYLPVDDLNVLVTRNFAPVEARAELLLSRLSQYPRVLEEAKGNLIDPSRPCVVNALEEAQGSLYFFRSTMAEITSKVPVILGKELEIKTEAAGGATEDFIHRLKHVVLPKARNDWAAGTDLYNHLLREWHLLPYDGDAIAALARETIEKTEKEMRHLVEKIKGTQKDVRGTQTDDTGVSSPVNTLIRQLRQEYPEPHEITGAYQSMVKKLKHFIREREIVTIPDEDRLEVRITPPFLQTYFPTNGYEPCPMLSKSATPGIYWVTLPPERLSEEERHDYLSEHTIYIIPTVTAHETYPGHHLSCLYARNSVSLVRKMACNPLADEGWAFYTEEMMEEQGFLQIIEQRLFRRKDQLFRAVRALIDVEIHRGAMSLQQGAALLSEKVCLAPEVARSEMRHYATNPTRAICYLVGKDEIMRLRDRYMGTMDNASLLKFHDDFLKSSMIPLSLIERSMFFQQTSFKQLS